MSSYELNANAPEFYPSNVRKVRHIYEKKIKEFKKYQDKGDNECAHIYTDDIYRTFITDIECGKLNKIEEIQFISSLIVKRVVIYDKNRWYA